MVGIGLRLAQDVGAHRRKVPSHKLTVEDEMWKRAWWFVFLLCEPLNTALIQHLRFLVVTDRLMSSSMGRPCAIQDEEYAIPFLVCPFTYCGAHSFDLDFPAECDDEYWENPDPKLAFKQPAGKPSYMAAFVSLIKLMKLLAFSLRTIVSSFFAHDGRL